MVMAVLARCSDRCARHAQLDTRARRPGPGHRTSLSIPLCGWRREHPGARSTLAAASGAASAHTQRAQVRRHREATQLKSTNMQDLLLIYIAVLIGAFLVSVCAWLYDEWQHQRIRPLSEVFDTPARRIFAIVVVIVVLLLMISR